MMSEDAMHHRICGVVSKVEAGLNERLIMDVALIIFASRLCLRMSERVVADRLLALAERMVGLEREEARAAS